MMHNKHEIIKKNLWKFQIWDGMYDLNDIDKLISESETKENEKPQDLLFEKTKLNIITDAGLTESLKRDLVHHHHQMLTWQSEQEIIQNHLIKQI